MAWSYNNTLPTDRDRVRFYVGDTDANDQLVQDEEIDAMLALFPATDAQRVQKAARRVCEHLAARFARLSLRRVQSGQDRIAYGDLAKYYRDLALTFEGAASTRIKRGGFKDYTTEEGEA